jgi:hypothetical protein
MYWEFLSYRYEDEQLISPYQIKLPYKKQERPDVKRINYELEGELYHYLCHPYLSECLNFLKFQYEQFTGDKNTFFDFLELVINSDKINNSFFITHEGLKTLTGQVNHTFLSLKRHEPIHQWIVKKKNENNLDAFNEREKSESEMKYLQQSDAGKYILKELVILTLFDEFGSEFPNETLDLWKKRWIGDESALPPLGIEGDYHRGNNKHLILTILHLCSPFPTLADGMNTYVHRKWGIKSYNSAVSRYVINNQENKHSAHKRICQILKKDKN